MTALFMPGLKLAAAFYAEVVRPLLDEAFTQLPYAAALLGQGSEVLGFDAERSTDHDWGPRLQIFLADDQSRGQATKITAMFSRRLPATFRDYPTAFRVTREPGGSAGHRVEVTGLASWLNSQLGFDPRRPITAADWLATSTQRLAEVTAGAVFHDGLGDLSQARTRLAWYPREVWLYVLACQWQRIAEEESFPGRCAEAGDELGSAIVTARLARDLMRLCLLMHRRYPPYSKWLGTAFFCQAFEAAAAMHNKLGITKPLDTQTRPFWNRPYRVLDAGRFTTALLAAVTDPQIRGLPAAGAVDQFIDSTEALGKTEFLRATIAAASRPKHHHSA